MPPSRFSTQVTASNARGGSVSYHVESYEQGLLALERLAPHVPRDWTWSVEVTG